MTSQRARIEQDVRHMRDQVVDPSVGPPWLERVVSMSSDKYEDPQADLDRLAALIPGRFPGTSTMMEGQYPTYTLSARIPAGVSPEDVRRFARDWVFAEGRSRAGSAPYQPKYGHGPDEYQSGYRYGLEAAAHERRSDARATLEQLESGSKTDFVRGQIVAYQERLGDRPSAASVGGEKPVAGAGRREVRVDTSVYRSYHGAEPRGRADWTFVIGKTSYETSDDPAIYRPARARGSRAGGVASLLYGEAKKLAVAEATRRGVAVVGVAP